MGQLCIMDHTGDTRHQWDPAVPGEVEGAKAQYDKMKAQGYMGYRVEAGGARGTVLREFDPAAGQIIMAKPLVGG